MCVIKPIKGRTTLSSGCRDYLCYGKGEVRDYFIGKGEDRCLAKDFLNLPSRYDVENWDVVMDKKRHDSGNDKPHGKRRAVTYRHYIISPNPKDECDLDTLRQLATSWCERNFGIDGGAFGTYQCAIFYHDDNSERVARGLPGIPHAHVIVNNTDLQTGNRLHVSKGGWRELYGSLECIAKDLGLSYFSVEKVVDEDGRTIYQSKHNVPALGKGEQIADYYHEPERYRKPRKYDSRPSGQDIYRSKVEREILAKGEVSWKDELRDCIDIACNLARNIDEFRETLEGMGVVTTQRAGRRANGNDLIFYYPQPGVDLKDNKKRVGGARLGRKYTNAAIEGKMKLAYYRRLDKNDRDEARLIDLVSEINVLEVKDPAKVSLKDISRAFAAINGAGLQTLDEARSRLSEHKALVGDRADDPAVKYSVEQIKNIEALLRVAEVSNILPPNDRYAATPPKDAQRRREVILSGGKKVPLSRKVDRGWPLAAQERSDLRRKSFGEYKRWERNYKLASQGRTSELVSGGGGSSSTGGDSGERRRSSGSSGAARTRSRS